VAQEQDMKRTRKKHNAVIKAKGWWWRRSGGRVPFFSVTEIKSIKLGSHIQRLAAVNYRVAICYTREARFTL
jgi:hypothetical protein